MIQEYITGTLDPADKSATIALNFDGGPVADMVFHTVSNSISWTPLALLFLYLVYKDGPGQWWRFCVILLGLVVTITLCDQVSSSIIKPLVMRPRPSHAEGVSELLHYVNNHRGGLYGFVSSHAANAFGATAYTSAMLRRRWFAMLAASYSALVCYSRIYLGMHYLGDIVCGALLGVLLGLLVAMAMRKWLRRMPRISHNQHS